MCTTFVGPNFKDFRLHLLLLGKYQQCMSIRELLLARQEAKSIHLEIYVSNDLETLVKSECELSFDFILICRDASEPSPEPVLNFFTSQLSLLDKHYLLTTKVAVVLAWEQKGIDKENKYREIFDFVSSYGLPVIRGDISNPRISEYMSDQILEMVMSVNGAWSACALPIAML